MRKLVVVVLLAVVGLGAYEELDATVVQTIRTDFHQFSLRSHSGEALYDVAWPVARGSRRTFSIASTWPRP